MVLVSNWLGDNIETIGLGAIMALGLILAHDIFSTLLGIVQAYLVACP